MKQVIQSYRTGKLEVAEVPVPRCRSGGVLVRNAASLISAGTEKSGLQLARKNIAGKAKSRPDLVKKVWQKVRTEGVKEAYRQSRGRLDQPVALGYSCAGEVTEVGEGAGGFRIGDRVACFGSGWASHAEVIFAPRNLCAALPAEVEFEEAAFAGVGAIALHGTRLLHTGLGDTVVVIGLGLLGLISLQLLKASGARVIGVDPEEWKVDLARELGADDACSSEEDACRTVRGLTGGAGVDAVIIMAATKSQRPVELAAELARERAVIAVPGLVGLTLPRSVFYQKELQLVIPHSGGPGIDDINYEERGFCYPISYVRWPAHRNLEGFLYLVGQKKVNLKKLITHRFPIGQADQAYKIISGEEQASYVGIVIEYPSEKPGEKKVFLTEKHVYSSRDTVNVGLIGAGLFAKGTLLPAIKGIPWIRLKGLATATGSSGAHAGRKWGFEYCTTDYTALFNDPEIDCLLIVTRHNSHAALAIEALNSGKAVFVEKPLALNREELRTVLKAYERSGGRLMVGYNRRFSPFSRKARSWLSRIGGPWVIDCRVNAGFIPPESWVQNRAEGGGRIIGEVGHFIDLIQYLTGSLPCRVFASSISGAGLPYQEEENIIINLQYADGSVAGITYTAAGDGLFPRERVEIFGGGSVCLIDNFRLVSLTRTGKVRKQKKMNIDRGHADEFLSFFTAVREGGDLPVDFREYLYTTVATFRIQESLRRGVPLEIEIEKYLASAGE
ncbi:MAG: bi-domain-containing oxidoreductase [PVC group bacterium]